MVAHTFNPNIEAELLNPRSAKATGDLSPKKFARDNPITMPRKFQFKPGRGEDNASFTYSPATL